MGGGASLQHLINQQNQSWAAQHAQQLQAQYGAGGLSGMANQRVNMCGVPTGALFHEAYHDEKKEEKKSMFKSVQDDFKGFMKENKSVIYWMALLLILDHYLFEDAFREKLKSLVHRMIGKVEDTLKLSEKKNEA